MGRLIRRVKATKINITDGRRVVREEALAVEEPLEIRLEHESFTVTMRTPGDDFDLVAGFLVSEGIIFEPEQLISLRFCAGEDENGQQTFNVVEAQLRPDVAMPLPAAQRHVTTSSACGICGTASIDAVHKSSHFRIAAPADEILLSASVLAALPDTLREQQKLFEKTGGVHAAGLFAPDGSSSHCARTWAGITPWTRWWVPRLGKSSFLWPIPFCRCREGPRLSSFKRQRWQGCRCSRP